MATRNYKKNGPKNMIILLIVLLLALLGFQLPDSLITDLIGEKTVEKTEAPIYNNAGPIDQGNAAFTQEDLKTSASWIQYEPLDSLGRAVGADALLDKARIGTGSSADPNIRPTGFISGKAPYYHSRGHLIARVLGGSGSDPRNLCTLYQQPVNSPYMTKYETLIRDALERGDLVRYRVRVLYDGNDLLPAAITLEAKSVKMNLIDFNIKIENKR